MDLVKKSIEVIKKLQLKNGGILATPTNGAYPYVYTRDSVFITKALNRVGLHKNSEKFYYFMKKFTRIEHFKEVFQRYNEQGMPCVTRKHQHDNIALLIHGIYDTYLHSKNKTFLVDMWPIVQICVNAIFSHMKDGLVDTEKSIHEFYRLENGFDIWVNSSSCRALYDAAEIAKILNSKEAIKWIRKAKNLNINIKKKFYNKKLGVFKKNLRHPNVADMSQLAPFYFNIIESEKQLKKTMEYLKNNIWYPELGGFRRFKKFEICKDWHWYTGGSGAWTFLTAWGARFYKELEDKKGYLNCIKFIEKTASRTNGLLPEHVATKEEYDLWKQNEVEYNKRTLNGMKRAEKMNLEFKKKFKEDIIYWATPLGWAHAEYIILKKGY